MGLMDILNGMQNGPRGQTDPNAKGGMSPITMALLALLAYKAYQKSGIGTGAPAPAPAPGRIPDRNTIDANPPGGRDMGGGLGDLLKGGLGGLLGGLTGGGATQGRLPGGRAAAPSGGGFDDLLKGGLGGLGGLLAGGAAGSVLGSGLDGLLKQMQQQGLGDVAELVGQQRSEPGYFDQRPRTLDRPRRHRRAGGSDRPVAQRSSVRVTATVAGSRRSTDAARPPADRGRDVALGVTKSILPRPIGWPRRLFVRSAADQTPAAVRSAHVVAGPVWRDVAAAAAIRTAVPAAAASFSDQGDVGLWGDAGRHDRRRLRCSGKGESGSEGGCREQGFHKAPLQSAVLSRTRIQRRDCDRTMAPALHGARQA